MRIPETKYARNGDVHMTYSVCGAGLVTDLEQL